MCTNHSREIRLSKEAETAEIKGRTKEKGDLEVKASRTYKNRQLRELEKRKTKIQKKRIK